MMMMMMMMMFPQALGSPVSTPVIKLNYPGVLKFKLKCSQIFNVKYYTI